MKKTEQNRLNMWRAVRLHLDANTAIWSSNEPFSEAAEALSHAIRDAWDVAEKQEASSRGLSTGRVAAEEEVVGRVLSIVRLARAYALNSDNHKLFHALRLSRGRLAVKSQAKLIAALRYIVNVTSPYAPELVRYGIAPEAYGEALEAIEELQSKQSAVRTAISGRKAAASSMPAVMKAGTLALVKLDNLVYAFERAHPEFLSGYKAARSIVHAGSRRREDDGTAQAA